MIEIRIPKEINTYEAKFIGPFTLRQCICLVLALPSCVVLFNLLKPYAPIEIIGFLMIIPAGIAYLFGWSSFYGMKFEKFIQSVFISTILAPTKRKYCTKNFYAFIAEEIRKEEQEALEQRNKGRKAKSKYKRSKDAIK